MPLTLWCVVTVRAVRVLARGARACGRGVIAQDFAFRGNLQLISCGITTIMGWAAVAPG